MKNQTVDCNPVNSNTATDNAYGRKRKENHMETKMLTANEARERLEMLKDPHARLEDQMREARAYKAAFNDYWMRGIVRDTLKKETGSAGGYLVPDSFERQILDTLGARNVLRQLCRIIQTTQDMTIPRVAGHGQAFWVPEGGTLPLSDDQFDHVTLGAYKLGTSEIISNELMEDSAFDMEKLIAGSFAARIADAEEDAFLNGDGDGKPLGLLSQANVGAVSESAGEVTLDDILNLIHSVTIPYRKRGVLLMSEGTLITLQKTRTAYDQTIWQHTLGKAYPDKLFEFPIVISDAMPDIAPGVTPVVFGDFNYFWIGDRGHHHFMRLNEVRARNDQVEFMLTKRVDAKLVLPDAIKTLQVA